MEAPSAKTTIFSFVSYDNHRVPQDPKSRTLIRRHAMKDVATTRKQRGNYRGGNAIQYPESVLRGEDKQGKHDSRSALALSVKGNKRRPTGRKVPKKASDDNNQAARQQLAHLHTIFIDHLEQKISTGFPILELIAPLTSLHLGMATISCFTSESGRMGDVLSESPQSNLQSRRLLSYLPSRYGKATVLTYTVDCLVARLNQITHSSGINGSYAEEDRIVLHHYAKALKEIQRAIDDEVLRMSQETLYATELLGIFELLSPQPQLNSWIYHAGGAARLIQLRGPDRFQTDFELALFMAHIGPIVTEAFLNNKPCFLTEEPWKKVLRTAICNDPSIPQDQSKLIHELWSSLIFGPEIFKMVTDLVLGPDDPPPAFIEAAIKRVQRDLDHLNLWIALLKQQQSKIEGDGINDTSFLTANDPPDWYSSRMYMPWSVLRGTYMMCSVLKRRLLSSLAPSRFSNIEVECQSLAESALGLDPESTTCQGKGLPGGLFMAQTVWVARAIINTRSIWHERGIGIQEGCQGPMIAKWKFRLWCKELGRIAV